MALLLSIWCSETCTSVQFSKLPGPAPRALLVQCFRTAPSAGFVARQNSSKLVNYTNVFFNEQKCVTQQLLNPETQSCAWSLKRGPPECLFAPGTHRGGRILSRRCRSRSACPRRIQVELPHLV